MDRAGDHSARAARREVLEETLSLCEANPYQGTIKPYELESCHWPALPPCHSLPRAHQPAFEVSREDCLVVAEREYRRSGEPPCVLNMASASRPGGGARHGAMAQEEELCRRTTLLPLLESLPYPMVYTREVTCGSFARDVWVMRHGPEQNYKFVDRSFPVHIVTVAARALRNGEGFGEKQQRIMRQRVEAVLHIAALQRCRTLVLSAFGCGVFRNPPAHVAQIFRDTLTGPYGQHFDRVVFAILDTRGEKNYETFARAFAGSR
jgi:uncharacterized protein (TIGR02452 family)